MDIRIADEQLHERVEQYLSTVPDLAISVPLEANDLYNLYGEIVALNAISTMQADLLYKTIDSYKQMIEIVKFYGVVDEQTEQEFNEAMSTIDQIFEQIHQTITPERAQ